MKLTKLERNDFESLFSLMKEAFPPEEYRPKEKQYAILDDQSYEATVLKEHGDINAFIAVWKLSGFNFAEHFAVRSTLRNKGIGSGFLRDYLQYTNSPLVLEVEDIEDEISKRRIEFYKRAGFILTDIRYDQPFFRKSAKRIPLRIMYHPNGAEIDTSLIKGEIFEKVYKRPVK